ncbi:MAG: hypothetical protein ACTHM0_10320 [Sphingomonas sp.]
MLLIGLALAGVAGMTPTPQALHKRPTENAPASHPSAPSVGTLDFKGVPLGISYDDFRKLPHPDGIATTQTICSGDNMMDLEIPIPPSEIEINDPIEKAVGIRKCIWISTYGPGKDDIAGLDLAGSRWALNEYSFSFAPDPKDGVLRMYQFSGMTNVRADDVVVQALTAKYGQPKTMSGTVQNRLGGTSDQVTDEWSRGTGSLIVRSPAVASDKMMVVMVDNRMSKIVDDEEAAKRAAVPNGI